MAAACWRSSWSLVINQQRANTSHEAVVEHRETGIPPEDARARPSARHARRGRHPAGWRPLRVRRVTPTQKASSGTSISALSMASAIARSAAIFGSTVRAKKDAAATLPV